MASGIEARNSLVRIASARFVAGSDEEGLESFRFTAIHYTPGIFRVTYCMSELGNK